MKKTAFFGLLACMLIMGFAVTGCDTTTGGETDTWSDITSLEQIDGRWKSAIPSDFMESMGLMEGIEGMGIEGITITTGGEYTVTFNASNANTGTVSVSVEMTITFSGSNIGTIWISIRQMMESILPDGGFNDANHSITITQDMGESQPITLSDMEGFQINQNGTKIKSPETEIEEGINIPELILIKQ
jgi:hypothetical protein